MTKLEELREKANRLPLLPGVYIMLDSSGEVIYVGKAKALKNRVTSYFRGDHLPKVAAMVEKVDDFHVIVAESEFEALVLENSLIKRHKPHYNILLKDDKGYPFIRLDEREAYPNFSLANYAKADGAKYFGPYGGRNLTFGILNAVRKTLQLPTCSKKFPRDIGQERPCLQYQIGKCAGWCKGQPDAEEYKKTIRRAEMVLEGRSSELTQALQGEMEQAAENLKFEKAAQLRDRIRDLSALGNKQKVLFASRADTDAIGFFRGAKSCFAVLHYVDGDLAAKDCSLFEDPTENDAEALSALLRQYYLPRAQFPKTILLPYVPEDVEDLTRLFTETAGHKVSLEVPQRGNRLEFLNRAMLNAKEEIQRSTTAQERQSKTLLWLKDTLQLPDVPKRIESYDISNTGNFGIVAGMVVFADGKPLKREYRKFRIRTTEGQDDYGSMREVISRRFTHFKEGDEKFSQIPDLLLIDGGAEHAKAAEASIEALGLHFSVFGMIKDDRHRTRALITSEGNEIGIQGNPAVFSFIGRIQEETHRFAIEYHRSLRDGVSSSVLDKIFGVGPARRTELLKAFKSVKAIREATMEQLQAVVPRNTAEAVYNFFHQEETSCESLQDNIEVEN